MAEARRFIRLALPGLAVVLEFALLVALTWPGSIHRLTAGLDPLAAGVVAVVASGGLGFIFSVLYFWIYWSALLGPHLAVDHEPALRLLLTALEDGSGDTAERRAIEARLDALPTAPMERRREAWVALTMWWFARVEHSSTLKGAEVKTRNLIDHAHALGTTWVGTAIAAGVWVSLAFWKPPDACWRVVLALAVWAVLWMSQFFNHRHLHNLFTRTVESAVQEFVADPRCRSDAKCERD